MRKAWHSRTYAISFKDKLTYGNATSGEDDNKSARAPLPEALQEIPQNFLRSLIFLLLEERRKPQIKQGTRARVSSNRLAESCMGWGRVMKCYLLQSLKVNTHALARYYSAPRFVFCFFLSHQECFKCISLNGKAAKHGTMYEDGNIPQRTTAKEIPLSPPCVCHAEIKFQAKVEQTYKWTWL